MPYPAALADAHGLLIWAATVQSIMQNGLDGRLSDDIVIHSDQ